MSGCQDYRHTPGYTAGVLEEYGNEIPRASRTELIVLAVNMPPQAPGPGQACRTTSNRSSSEIRPTA
jgi:hypothetical protein